jgi:hypothetical protein
MTAVLMFSETSGLFGPALTSEARVAAAILARPHGEYTEHDIAQVIVPTYFRLSASVGLNPVLVVAQAIVETENFSSWWAARPRRNPAGLGVSGRTSATRPADGANWEWDERGQFWRSGCRFATWQDAIPAHVGRLLAYVLASKDTSERDRPLINQALGYLPLNGRVRGTVRCLRQLGQRHNPSGLGWAKPGTYYGKNIAAVAQRLAG